MFSPSSFLFFFPMFFSFFAKHSACSFFGSLEVVDMTYVHMQCANAEQCLHLLQNKNSAPMMTRSVATLIPNMQGDAPSILCLGLPIRPDLVSRSNSLCILCSLVVSSWKRNPTLSRAINRRVKASSSFPVHRPSASHQRTSLLKRLTRITRTTTLPQHRLGMAE